MFGIFYLLFDRTMYGISKIRQDVENMNARDKAKKQGNITYYGENGERLVETDKSVYRKYQNGDLVLADLYTGQVYKNYTEEKRIEKETEASDMGYTVINVSYDEIQEYNRKERYLAKSIMIRPQYRDIKTRRYYIDVCINGLVFYMDIVTGELIRLKDGQDEKKKWGILSIDEIINIVNKRQRDLYDTSSKNHPQMWWENHFYLRKSSKEIFFINNDGSIVEGNVYDENIELIKKRIQNNY